eukprot:gnl/TRDRNA2_/TRDRNA2_177067_c0_seq23.p1 gnl/TRDRNA2_/TRDRNA2_177067_c0~~gnl/TRDRNA2_/TRDRNA2_177067_c0_seq23.p1  ORF type:complete len:693 (-),score=81.90 gnl/TRDRNA2_/TRDRNA2_177067_c0_seq23:93-1952(-)
MGRCHISLLQTRAQIVRSNRKNWHWSDSIDDSNIDRVMLRPWKVANGAQAWYGGKGRTIVYPDHMEIDIPFNQGVKAATGRTLYRPIWQKNLRCRGPSSMSCEECAGKENCWSFSERNPFRLDGPSWQARLFSVVNAAQGEWVRFVNLIHVQCNSPVLYVNLWLWEVKNAKLRVRWDGAEVTKKTEGAMLWFSKQEKIIMGGTEHRINKAADHEMAQRNHLPDADFPVVGDSIGRISGLPPEYPAVRIDLALPAHVKGGHELEIEVETTELPAYVASNEITLYMPSSFSMCEDMKMCLELLTKQGEGGWKLRNTNTLQKRCLSSGWEGDPILTQEDASSACKKWRNCLKHNQVPLFTLLKAAGVGEFQAALTELTASRGHTYTRYPGMRVKGGYASGDKTVRDVEGSKARCDELGSECGGFICVPDESTCTVRKNSELKSAKANVVAYVKDSSKTMIPAAATTPASGTEAPTHAPPTVKDSSTTVIPAAATTPASGAEAQPHAAPTCSSDSIYPPNEDPESWDCDCYEEMLQRCQAVDTKNLPKGDYTEDLCLRAHFCIFPRVCAAWKAASCRSPLVVAMQGALQDLTTTKVALQARAVSSSSHAETKLDSAAMAKRCK